MVQFVAIVLLCLQFLKKKKDGWEKIASRGDFRWHREDKFVTVQWKDCKVVTVISSLHQGSKLSSCNITFQGRTSWKKQCVKQPDCVKCYNEGMFGVNKSNQYLSRYPCYIKSKFHWWKVLFFQSIDILIVNAILFSRNLKKKAHKSLIIYLYILVSWNSENLL